MADVVKASDEDMTWLGEGVDPVEMLAGLPDENRATNRHPDDGEHCVVAMTAAGVEIRVPGSEPAPIHHAGTNQVDLPSRM
ncbi:hypothetical protein [Cutibacterium sp. V947]|uniref:hypothetical protein n=1 Tax=unclassified Cutibacterium TaxID=2649671 RepID=UPI003EE1FCBB